MVTRIAWPIPWWRRISARTQSYPLSCVSRTLSVSPLPSAPPLLLRARRDNRKEAAAVSIGPAWHGRSQRWSSSSLPCSVCAAPSALRVPPPMLNVLLDLTLPQAHGGRHSGGASMWTRGGARWPRRGHVGGREGQRPSSMVGPHSSATVRATFTRRKVILRFQLCNI